MTLKFYEGTYGQRGYGFGGFFKGLFNILRPVITSPITKEIAKEVLTTGAKIGADVISGKKTFKESAKENINTARKKVAKTVLTNFTSDDDGSGSENEAPAVKPSFKKGIKRKNVAYNTNTKRPKIVI